MNPARPLSAALVAAQVAYPQIPERHGVAATRGVVALMTATTLADAMHRRGPAKGALLVGSAGAIGFGAEVLGVRTGVPFGGYWYSGKLGPKAAGVPLAAAAAWAMMARPAWSAAGWITMRRAPRAALAAAALTAWDVALDPRMVREGYWTWPGGGRYEAVPVSNFLGWLVTGGAIFALWAALDGDDDPAAPAPDGGARARSGDEALGMYAWTWAGEVAANLLFWGRPRVAAAAGVGMGAVALPALRRRLRGRR